MSEDCSCVLAGYCERHKLTKGNHWFHLCQTRDDYREKWDGGTGPGQRNPELQEKIRVARKTRIELGQQLWAEVHTEKTPTPKWFNAWLQRVPSFGCGCREKARKLIEEHPPDYENWFEYSVLLHNLVNSTLPGKRQWTIEEARSRWSGVFTE